MNSHRVGVVLLLLAVLSWEGCADVSLRAGRVRAEKLLWQARREEQRLRLGGARLDSTGIARLRSLYRKVRDEVPVPAADTSASLATQRLRVSLARVVGEAELSGMRLAFEAGRPGEALEKARWVMAFAGQDTLLLREAHFGMIDALRGLHRENDAAREMWRALDEYPPVPPRTPGEQDPILKVPLLIAALHAQDGDTAQVRADLKRGAGYFQRLLTQRPPPLLEAQILVQLAQEQTQLGDRAGALRSLSELERIATATPALSSDLAEVLCTKADLESMRGGDPVAALAIYNDVIQKYPGTPFAPRALIGAAVLEESAGKRKEALARYKAVLDRYGSDGEHAPIALFRSAMLQDQLGDWPAALQLLNTAPQRYPRTQAALEAPMAIVDHYRRGGNADAQRAAVGKAIDTYRGLIASDSTNPMDVAFRWNLARCYAGLDRWNDALSTIDEMSERNPRSALTANAVFEAARICGNLGNQARRRAYLSRYIADYPAGPRAAEARAALQSGGTGASNEGPRSPGARRR